MILQSSFSGKWFAARFAGKWSFSRMNFGVLVHVAFCDEALAAKMTNKRTFTCNLKCMICEIITLAVGTKNKNWQYSISPIRYFKLTCDKWFKLIGTYKMCLMFMQVIVFLRSSLLKGKSQGEKANFFKFKLVSIHDRCKYLKHLFTNML